MGTAATRAKNKWQAKNIDRVNLTMPKGKKELVQAHAEALGTSVNGFINRAIDETMDRDKAAQDTPESRAEGSGEAGE